MTIISSQHYLDFGIVDQKENALAASNTSEVKIQCGYAGYIDGEEFAIVIDGHHTMAAAKRLGISIVFDVEEDCENLVGEALLEARYLDGEYYRVDSSDPEEEKFDLVW